MKLYQLYDTLFKQYGPQGWWPINGAYYKKDYSEKNENEKFEIAVGAILTQNTKWVNVEKVLKLLRRNQLLNREGIQDIESQALAVLIKPSGYYNQKVKKLKSLASFNKVISRESLLEIWGIGPETADSILLYAYNEPIFVIDSYTKRIMLKYNIGDINWDYNQWQTFFHNNLEKDYKIFNEFHALIVKHAQSIKLN
ncbi:MAG: hypothetical protein VX370_00340 [Bacteroidota bacterium]|nr:hypothetical protein [Bacteroidota bacterium]